MLKLFYFGKLSIVLTDRLSLEKNTECISFYSQQIHYLVNGHGLLGAASGEEQGTQPSVAAFQTVPPGAERIHMRTIFGLVCLILSSE